MINNDRSKQRELIKVRIFKERLSYFWYYNKMKLIFVSVITIFVICLIANMFHSSKEKSIFVVLTNTKLNNITDTTLVDDYVKSRHINTGAHPADFDISIKFNQDSSNPISENSLEKLWIYLEDDNVDIVVGNDYMLDSFSDMKPFKNLSEVLPKDLYEKYKDNFIYYDYEKHAKIPIAIDISDCSKLKDTGIYNSEDTLILGIPVSSIRIDTAIDFLRYLYEQ
jgi:hypothetical protein